MARLGRPTERPGYAQVGQYACKRLLADPETGRRRSCGKEVPEGELTWSALNDRSGDYLALCLGCRAELDEVHEDFATASVGTARLLASNEKLPTGILVSHTALREVLLESGEEVSKNGPLTTDQKLRAVEKKFGAGMRERLAAMWQRRG